jgi:hypothetical protein
LRRFENAGLEFIASTSNTNLLTNAKALNFPIRSLYKNGCNFNFFEMTGWSNPATYGIADYPFKDLALFLPNTQATVKMGSKDSDSMVLNNLTIGYLNYGGEDRTRVIKRIDGMTGIESEGVDQYDEMNYYILSELAVLFSEVNKTILSYKE